MASSLTLGRNERLKSRKLIGRVFEEGKKINTGSIRVHYLLGKGEPTVLQVGVTVSARNFRRAPDRNRIKRLLREAWRLQKNELRDSLSENKQLFVFIIYTAGEILPFESLRADVTKLLKKLSAVINKQD